jgi:hypothetical protein
MTIKINKKYKILVNITFFIDYNFIKRFSILERVVANYLKFFCNIDIYIHTNLNLKNKFRIKGVRYIVHNLVKNDRWKLPWKCRDAIYYNRKNYDFYIYSEDDILFKKNNFEYWIQYKDILINKNYNLGFTRIEKYNNTTFAIDINKKISRSKILRINNKEFIMHNNPYYGFWIYDQIELNKFIKSKFWNLNNWIENKFYGPLEMSGTGWHGLNMKRYKATLLLIKKNQIDKNATIQHAGNIYSNPAKNVLGLNFGKIKLKDAIL